MFQSHALVLKSSISFFVSKSLDHCSPIYSKKLQIQEDPVEIVISRRTNVYRRMSLDHFKELCLVPHS
jgi:hypothetical protein